MDFDSPDIDARREDVSRPDTARKGARVWLILILVGFLLLALVVALSNAGVSTVTQTTTENQCPQAGQGFDERQAAFTLAQKAEEQRVATPTTANYGLSSYIVCYQNGTEQGDQSPVFKGYDNYTYTDHPRNYTHSEQSAYGWLQLQFSRLSIDLNQVTTIYTVIFTQTAMCSSCKKDAVSWQRTLRQKANTDKVSLSIWEIPFGQGFDPATYPIGTGIPITQDMIEKVRIQFLP